MLFLLRFFFMLAFFGAAVGAIGVTAALYHYSRDLPDHRAMQEYSPPVMSRVYAYDGRVLTRFAEEERLFVPYERLPKQLTHAFISAEDKNFFTHHGLDPVGILRAALHNLKVVSGEGGKGGLSGGSTITQQVVKNFLLTGEKTLTRKIKEAILAVRISREFSKEKILELYLNQIYLGDGAYGVAAAALNYFGKPAEDLRLEETALLAALPKAPSKINPRVYPERAKERRDFVIGRMLEDGYISEAEALLARGRPIVLAKYEGGDIVNGTFFTDVVRQQIIARYTKETLYNGGLSIWTTLRPEYQRIAEHALKDGVVAYDRRHGWRGAQSKVDLAQKDWKESFGKTEYKSSSYGWRPAVVTEAKKEQAELYFQDGESGVLPLAEMAWAAKFKSRDSVGPKPSSTADALAPGDVIYVSPKEGGKGVYSLEQMPEADGAIVAMDPETGKVLALVGGFDYAVNQYNRASQAKRQPGSSIKPFVYLTALENGFMPNSIVIDEEIALPKGTAGVGEDVWRPENHTGEYYGAKTLRFGLEKSLNAMTVSLGRMVGIYPISETFLRYGITDKPTPYLSAVLGTVETHLLDITAAYAMLANGGKRIAPSFIEWVQNKSGQAVMRRDVRVCEACDLKEPNAPSSDFPPVPLEGPREPLSDPVRAHQMVSMLQGVIQRGTGSKAQVLNRPAAGKTGTTDNSYDAWFVGFTPSLAVGVYVGFDSPKSLGNHEYGATAALPIWIDFMRQALKDVPPIPFTRPDGVKLVKIDYETGGPPSSYDDGRTVIYEAFKKTDDPFTHLQAEGMSNPYDATETWGDPSGAATEGGEGGKVQEEDIYRGGVY
jgi:penicillin-binding protein 1A